MSKEKDLALIVRLRKAKAIIAIGTIASAAATIGAVALWRYGKFGAGLNGYLVAVLLGGGTLFLTARFLRILRSRWDIETSQVYQVFKNSSGRVLWLFHGELKANAISINGVTERIVFVCMDDGKIERVRGVSKGNLKDV